MPKTYTSVPSVSTGDVYQASTYNTYTAQNLNNLIVPPAVRARRAAAQAMINGSITALNFDTQDYDTDDMFAPTANFITVNTAGIYIVTGAVSLSASATGNRAALIYVNPTYSGSGDSATITAGTILCKSAHAVQSSTDADTVVATAYAFNANDKIALGFFHNHGGNLNTNSVTEPYVVHLSATWIGRTS